MGSEQLNELYEALGESQRLGFLGGRSITEVVDHARLFVAALDGLESARGESLEVIDLGSGGGVPGLVIAYYRPDVAVTLLDRRTKRTDFLRRVVSRLGWSGRVTVIADDAVDVVKSKRGFYDCVVARGFGLPDLTLKLATDFVRPGGRVIISEPPQGDRWRSELLEELDVDRLSSATRVAIFERRQAT